MGRRSNIQRLAPKGPTKPTPRSETTESSELNQAYYQAMRSRDSRFDGKFFVGVKTTGIYCRPICPAKPKLENVEFFKSHLAAERSGYRPCLRCRPESAPKSPVWIGKSAVVRRALKILHQSETLHFNEDRFATLFGVSARHLRRLFIEEIGKTPKQLAFENRLNLARTLLVETHLPITEIAFASGFNSIRRFNSAFKERFRKAPAEIRRRKLAPDAPLRIALPYRPPFDFDGLLAFYHSHQVGDLERFEPGQMTRTVKFGGKIGEVSISHDPNHARVILEIRQIDSIFLQRIVSRARQLLDLDCDPWVIANVMGKNAKLAPLLKRYPGIRLPSGWDPWEVAIGTILGQWVSVAAGRKLVADLIDLAGVDSGVQRDGKRVRLFPSPSELAKANLSSLKTTAARKHTLLAFAKEVDSGRLSLEPTQDVDAFIRDIQGIPGIGPWTAHSIALRALRDADAFPETDLVLAQALEGIEPIRPWRGYAAALFWRQYSDHRNSAKKGAKI